jgi:hypothetical protein
VASDGVSNRAVKRRLRAARKLVNLLDQELKALADDIPCPSEEELVAMLSFEAPLTQEAALLGMANLADFYLAEAGEILSLALSTTPANLKSDPQRWSIRSDLRRSLTHVLDGRSHKGQAS